ncbi:MAG: glycoside hydrolase family 5 protein [Saprospiraceae bacterium]|nr:glycoside hydrolase family 5 protein [Saprospiraceae bacterium]
MKNCIILPALLFMIWVSPCLAQQTVDPVFDIHRGLNISHWLSQSKKRGVERIDYFTEADVKAVADAGFDHIRIPIDEEQMWDEDGNKEVEAFALLHAALGWIMKHQMKALVDLHIVRSHHFLDDAPALYSDPGEQEKFGNLWQQLSAELRHYPLEDVAYELLNESVAKDHEDWNKVYQIAYDRVRAIEPERVIFVGPNRWQQPKYFTHLEVPAGDPNIVLSFHFYTPHPVTHHKASWDKIRYWTGPIQYPGYPIDAKDTIGISADTMQYVRHHVQTLYDQEVLEKLILLAVDKSRQTGLQLYCGEFGSYDTAPAEVRHRWFKDVIQLFEKHKISWTAWDLKSNGFGILDAQRLRDGDPNPFKVPRSLLFQDQ